VHLGYSEQSPIERVDVANESIRVQQLPHPLRSRRAETLGFALVEHEPRATAVASSASSPGAQTYPVSPSATSLAMPPTRVVTTGRPAACAPIAVTRRALVVGGHREDVAREIDVGHVVAEAGPHEAVAEACRLSGDCWSIPSDSPCSTNSTGRLHSMQRITANAAWSPSGFAVGTSIASPLVGAAPKCVRACSRK
jgi:hypothetical protein